MDLMSQDCDACECVATLGDDSGLLVNYDNVVFDSLTASDFIKTSNFLTTILVMKQRKKCERFNVSNPWTYLTIFIPSSLSSVLLSLSETKVFL